jgi:general nucleoside transport system permease protein
MSSDAEAPAQASSPRRASGGATARQLLFGALRTLLPILLALLVGAVILLLLDADPLAYYGYVLRRGLFTWSGLQETIIRTAPLLLIAAGLIVAFRAGIWNLGVDGQFLLAAVVTAALAPQLVGALGRYPTILVCLIVAFLVGAAWSLIPAFLKARFGVNEIITTLMMSFLGISFANVLIKIPFKDPATTVPQTETLPVVDRLPRLGDTTINSGVILAVIAVLLVHLLMTRTAFGLKLQIVGANPRAAVHAGLSVAKLTYATFALSAGFAGLAGAVDILGVWGNVRADWNPAYGLLAIPLVFLARFHGIGVIAFVLFFAVLLIGGESASRRLGVPHYYVLVLVALLLIFLALVEYLDHRWRQRTKA